MKSKLLFVIVILALLLSGFTPAAPAQSSQVAYVSQMTLATIKLVFNNKTAETVRMALTGPASYNFTLPPGKSSQMVLPGKYTYTYTACGENKTGNLTVKKSGDTLTLAACPKKPPTPPATYKLVLNNKTGETIKVTLTGPMTYTFTLQPGKTSQDVKPGKYRYSYQACQGEKKGTVEVKKNGTLLVLAACPKNQKASSGEVNVKIKNDTGGTVWLNLSGPATYSFSLAPGKSTITVLKGRYNYTAYGCGGASVSGTKQIRSNMEWRFWCMP
jgi:hypothetical protein